MDVLILLNRITLGYYVMNAGWQKVQRELAGGWGTFLRSDTFDGRSGILPDVMAVPFGYGWPWLELVTGFLLLIGLFTRVSAVVMTGLLLSILIALFFAGDALPRHELMVFVPVALLLAFYGPDRYSADRLIFTRGRRR